MSDGDAPAGPADAWAEDPEGAEPPDHSIVADERLVAYVWAGSSGHLRRAGGMHPPVAIAFGDVLLFDAERAALIEKLATAAADFDSFHFAVGLEGMSWVEGAATPHARLRRF